MGGFYMQYLESLCRRRGWTDPSYECYRDHSGYTCLVLVNGREYQTDLAYESDSLAQENAAMRAFMVCRNFSVNGGMLARNGIVQGLPATETGRRSKKSSRHTSSSHGSRESHRRSGHHSSSSSTASFD
ncbi:double-stranded RNA binding motif protein [Colletotrichum truncatum]|uniref:Double-stranded RNA binding motif protein n=1 Tax=Colletotrichum truncatum TaxID=5467 RepID=A0ACC3ZCU5_COLTU|nr:double-stranded RNA binding motif protein [Colletotrichum truncatum]KAF6797853.1 double-stranded RNA binding motif protein [Colletotrichum truncatum]